MLCEVEADRNSPREKAREECPSKGTAWTPALCWERAGHIPKAGRGPV